MPCVAYLLVRYAWLYNAVDVDVVAEAIKNRQILASQPISLRGPASKWADPYDNIAHSLFGTRITGSQVALPTHCALWAEQDDPHLFCIGEAAHQACLVTTKEEAGCSCCT